MIIKIIPAGPLQTNCYIVIDEKLKDAIVIDPGQDPDLIIREIEALNCKVCSYFINSCSCRS